MMANCVAADPGGIWIGTSERRVFQWQDGQVRAYGVAEGLAPRVVRGLAVDRRGTLWICGEMPDAVQYFRDGTFHDVPLPPGVHHLRTLVEDGEGAVWKSPVAEILDRVGHF